MDEMTVQHILIFNWIVVPILSTFVIFVHFLYPPLSLIETGLISIVIGHTTSSLIHYVVTYLFFGELIATSFYVTLLIYILPAIFCFSKTRTKLKERKALWQSELKSNKLIFGVLLLAGISFTLYFQRILVIEENNWKCTKKAADNLNIHLGIIHSFLHGVNSEFQSFIPISPFFANEKLLLSFLPDFYIAGLVSQALEIQKAIKLGSIILSTVSIGILYCLCDRLLGRGKKRLFVIVSLFVSLFSGGSGFINWITYYKGDLQILKIVDFVEETSPNLRYPLFWKAFLSDILISDHTLIYGFSICFSILLMFYIFLHSDLSLNYTLSLSFFSAVFSSLLNFIHRPSFISISVFIFCLFLFDSVNLRKNHQRFAGWFQFFIIYFAFGFSVEMYYLSRFLFDPAVETHYLEIKSLWFQDKYLSRFVKTFTFRRPILFWVRNLFAFLPLAFFSAFLKRGNIQHRNFIFTGILGFLLFNILQFYSDKTLILESLYLFIFILSFGVTFTLYKIFNFRGKLPSKLVAALLFSILIFSACLALVQSFHEPLHTFHDSDEVIVSTWINQNLPTTSIFISSLTSNNIIPTLTGRSLYLSNSALSNQHHYINYKERLEFFKKILVADTSGLITIANKKINYILVDPALKQNVNNTLWEGKFPVIFEHGNYTIYNSTARAARPSPKNNKKKRN